MPATFERIENGQQYPTFDLLASDLMRSIPKDALPGNIEDEIAWEIGRVTERSGFVTASRNLSDGGRTVRHTLTVLIEDNRPVARNRTEGYAEFVA